MAIPEKIKMDLDQFIAQVIIGRSTYDPPLCFILGAGSSISSGIPSGKALAWEWIDHIMNNGYTDSVRRSAEMLYKTRDIEHEFREIEHAWVDAKQKGEKTLSSDYYFDLFVLRFHGTKGGGIRELQHLMKDREPSLGYYLMSQVLTAHNCRNNVVITTNFDSLVEKAVFAYTQQAPVVVTHESLVESMRWNIPYPIIAKVHRDLMFSPLNSIKELKKLKRQWRNPLQKVMEDYTPIVIGYAGADQSLMSFLEDKATTFHNGLYWCYRDQDGVPDKRVINLIQKKRGFLVPIEGFDELMVRISPTSNDEPLNYIDSTINALQDLQNRYNLNIKRYEEDLERIARIIESKRPSTSWGFFNRAYRYAEEGEYQEAIADYSTAIEREPDFVEAYNNRGVAYANLGDNRAAIEEYNKAIKRRPNFTEAYNNRGNAYHHLGNHKAAIEDYNKAIDLKPDYAEAYNNRAVAFADLGNHKAAIEDYNKAIDLKPDYANAYNNRGKSYVGLDDPSAAMADYNKALKLKPNHAEAYNNRGNIFANSGDYKAAIEDYNKALEIKPDYAEAYNNRGAALVNAGYCKSAIEDYNKAIELKPNLTIVYHNRGEAFANLGYHQTAIEDYNKAIELNPNFAIAYHNRGEAYEKLGNQQAAEADLKKAWELDPTLKDS